jgi:hypothetical protein
LKTDRLKKKKGELVGACLCSELNKITIEKIKKVPKNREFRKIVFALNKITRN